MELVPFLELSQDLLSERSVMPGDAARQGAVLLAVEIEIFVKSN